MKSQDQDKKGQKDPASSLDFSANEISVEQQLDELLIQLLKENLTSFTPEAKEALDKLYPLALSIAQSLKTPDQFEELLNLAEISLKATNRPTISGISHEKVDNSFPREQADGDDSETSKKALEGIQDLRQKLEKLAAEFNQPLADLIGPAPQPDSHKNNNGGELNLTVLGSLLYQAVREALSKNTFQQIEGSPWPTALLEKGPSGGQAQLRPAILETEPLLAGSEIENWSRLMWKQREELSDLDADALDLLSHTWLEQARSPGHYAVGDVDQFLTRRGLKPKQGGEGRRGGYEPEQRAEMLKALSHIQNLWLNMGRLETHTGKTKKRKGSRSETKNNLEQNVVEEIQSKAFIITDRMGQLNLDGYMDVRRFIFQPGRLFAHYLFGPGREIALLSARAVQYDPYRQKWEKRLARYLSWQWRNQAQRGDYLRPYQINTLLQTIGEEVNQRYPSKTRERLEKALDTLQKDQVISGWQYDRWNEEATNHRGWIEEWVQSTLLIEPPEVIKEAYQPITLLSPAENDTSETGQKLPLITPETLELVVQLKQRRKALRLSQLQMAERLKIAQSYFSKLENGHLNPSPAIYKRLKEWLETTNPF